MLKHWLPMTSIPVEMCRISSDNFQGIISKTTDFSCNFYFFSQIYIKFRTFSFKKDESPSLSISQIIDSERGGFLNVLKRLTSEHLPAINVVTG